MKTEQVISASNFLFFSEKNFENCLSDKIECMWPYFTWKTLMDWHFQHIPWAKWKKCQWLFLI